MADQDWTPVVLTKNKPTKTSNLSASAVARGKSSGTITSERKMGAAENKSAHSGAGANARKLEESTEDFHHNTVNASLSKAITQARIAKKMTQQQLATAINERAQVIQQYESGKAIPNPQIINKLDKALGTHLPRKKK